MVIRRATNEDIEGLNKLLLQVLMVHHNGRPDLFKANTKKYTDEELVAIIADDNHVFNRHFIKIHRLGDALSRQIHKGLRFHQKHLFALHFEGVAEGFELYAVNLDLILLGDFVNRHKPCVVAGEVVL